MVTLLPLYPGKYNPSVGDKGGSRRGTHTAPRPYMARAPFGFGSLGACPGHSPTVIAASSAPNSLHICVLTFPNSDCINAATADFVPGRLSRLAARFANSAGFAIFAAIRRASRKRARVTTFACCSNDEGRQRGGCGA
jgi:hypothetical protein